MKKDSKEDFIKKSQKKFGDKFDYSKVDYKNSSTKVTLICKDCGYEFNVTPNKHLTSRVGCPKCSGLKRWDTAEFIKRAREVHGNKYDYSKVNYINKRTKVLIICPEHGEFWQNPHNHVSSKNGCPICGQIKVRNRTDCSYNPRKTKEQFQKDLNQMYGGKYEIVGDYVNNKTHTQIYCHCKGHNGKEHGIFITRPDGLINGHGCPKCASQISKGEDEIFNFIKEYYDGKIIRHDRKILSGRELDLYLPERKIAFEYDGVIWHSDKYKDKTDILRKTEDCEKQGIQLIHIFEDEWYDKKEICKSRIKGIIQKNERIYARKCLLKEITQKDAQDFLNTNHLQGSINSKIRIGLFYNNELVALMTFGSLRKNLGQVSKNGYYEMLRFCNKLFYNVVGGASKLLNYFIKQYKPIEIISYADRRWSMGHLYEKIGFTKVKTTVQNYSYVKDSGWKRINRFAMRKDILMKKYGCPESMTEKEFCEANKYHRVYDCGNIKYVWKIE